MTQGVCEHGGEDGKCERCYDEIWAPKRIKEHKKEIKILIKEHKKAQQSIDKKLIKFYQEVVNATGTFPVVDYGNQIRRLQNVQQTLVTLILCLKEMYSALSITDSSQIRAKQLTHLMEVIARGRSL